MTPRLLLTEIIQLHFLEPLQSLGFNYSHSRLSFKRIVAHYTQHLSFSLNRHNRANSCNFWTMWGVSHNGFLRWYKAEFSKNPANSAIWGSTDWNLPQWPRKHGFNLDNSPSDHAEVAACLEAILNIRVPMLDRYSDLETILQKPPQLLPPLQIVDLLLFANRRKEALQTARSFIQAISAGRLADPFRDLPILEERVQRYAKTGGTSHN